MTTEVDNAVMVKATEDRIAQIKSDMEGVRNDLGYAKAQAKLDEVAPVSENGGSSAQAVLEQHQGRIDFLEKSLSAAEQYLKELQGK